MELDLEPLYQRYPTAKRRAEAANRDIWELLVDAYVKGGNSTEAARILQVSRNTALAWLSAIGRDWGHVRDAAKEHGWKYASAKAEDAA